MPFGVMAAIIPWNYPFHNMLGQVISALFAGNAIVIKASEHACWSVVLCALQTGPHRRLAYLVFRTPGRRLTMRRSSSKPFDSSGTAPTSCRLCMARARRGKP